MVSKVSTKLLDIQTTAISKVDAIDIGLRFYAPDGSYQDLDLVSAIQNSASSMILNHTHDALVSGNTTARISSTGHLEITDNIKIFSTITNKTYNPVFALDKTDIFKGESVVLSISEGPENSIVAINASGIVDTMALDSSGSGSKTYTMNNSGTFVFAGVFGAVLS